MIPIDPQKKPAPIDEKKNVHSRGGKKLNLERAITIMQLEGDENGPFYTGTEIAATKWEVGSEEYKKQGRRFRSAAVRHLEPSNLDPVSGNFLPTVEEQTTYAGWSAPALRGMLTKETHEEATKEINSVRKRARGQKKSLVYIFDNGSIRVFDLDKEEPDLPDSHYSRTSVEKKSREELGDEGVANGDEESYYQEKMGDETPISTAEKESSSQGETADEPPVSTNPINNRYPWALAAILAVTLIVILVKFEGLKNSKIHSSAHWALRPVAENREKLNLEPNPLQRSAIAQGSAMQTNSDRPFVLDETRVMVACDRGRKFVLMPDRVIELGDWVVIPSGDDPIRGALIDLNIRQATIRTLSGEKKTVELPYPENWIQISMGMRNIEVLPMEGGNLIRIIEAWCSIRGEYTHGPLDDLSNSAVIGLFDSFEELLNLSSELVGIGIRGSHIFPKSKGGRWYIRWERPYWRRDTLQNIATETANRTGLTITVLESDSEVMIEFGARPFAKIFEAGGVESSVIQGNEIVWRTK